MALGLTDEQINTILDEIHNGTINRRNLPIHIYTQLLALFTEEIENGLVGLGENQEIDDLFKDFSHSAGKFSAAKTFQQVNDLMNILFDEDGNKVTRDVFRSKGRKIFDLYNETWLQTELVTANAVAQGAQSWIDAQEDKETLPLLQYQTANDERVRESHAAWDNIVRPVDDPFWNTHMPPNGYNCRCIVIQLEEDEAEVTQLDESVPNVTEPFNVNPGKSGNLFDPSHPYYDVPDRFEEFKKNNFGFNVPEKSS
jgi:SPP1 gp7 family putative phage head morphogenesis protein